MTTSWDSSLLVMNSLSHFRPVSSASAVDSFNNCKPSRSRLAAASVTSTPSSSLAVASCSGSGGSGIVRDPRLVGLIFAWLTPGVANLRIRDWQFADHNKALSQNEFAWLATVLSRDSPDQTNFPGNSSFWDTVKYNPAFQGRQMRPDSLKFPVFI